MREPFQKSGIARRPDQRTNIGTLLIELFGNVGAEESRGSRQQDPHLSSLFGRSSAPVEFHTVSRFAPNTQRSRSSTIETAAPAASHFQLSWRKLIM